MWGETCRWAAILSDPALVSVVYIVVKIPCVRRLSQYLEGQWDYPSQIYSHLVVPHPVFVFGARFASPRMALGPMCPLMCWLSRIKPKIPRRGAPGVGTVGAWVGQKAESPRRARATRVPRQVLPQGAKTRVRVFTDIQNFALRARHSQGPYPSGRLHRPKNCTKLPPHFVSDLVKKSFNSKPTLPQTVIRRRGRMRTQVAEPCLVLCFVVHGEEGLQPLGPIGCWHRSRLTGVQQTPITNGMESNTMLYNTNGDRA